MPVSIKHKFQSAFPDIPADVAAGHLVPSKWNEEHDIIGIILSVNNKTPDANGNVDVAAGGAVDSVNGQTGVVVLGAADVGAASTTHADALHIADTGTDPLHAYDVNAMSYHGWLNRDMTVGATPVTYGPLPRQLTTSTFTLYGSRSTCVYYYQATKVTVTTDKTATLDDGAGGSTAGLYFVYFNGLTGNILATKVFPGVLSTSNVIIATVTWNGTNVGWVNDERHGYLRNGIWHLYQHTHVGALYGSGIVFTPTGSGAGLTFATSSGDIDDEDISFTINASSAFPTANTCRLARQTSATTYAFDDAVSTKPFYWNGGTTRVQYVDAATSYALVDAGSARYINVWLYATTDLHTPIVAIAETLLTATTGYTTIANARAITPPNISGLGISAEMKVLYRLIMTGAGTIAETTDYRASSPLPAGGSASTSAAAVSFTPAGNIASVTVQGALEELDTEKQAAVMTTAGDMIYGGTEGVPTRLAKGTDGQVLTLEGGVPSWATAGGGGLIDYASGNVSITGAGNATISRKNVCTGTSADYPVMLPAVQAGKGIEIAISGAMTKLVHISTGADAVSKSGTVTGGTSVNAAGTGTVSTSGSSTTLTGAGTAFTTQLRVGDTLIVSTSTNTRFVTVTDIASATSLIMSAALTVSSSAFRYTQTGIAGSGTALSTDYTVGDGITIGGLTRRVTYVNGASGIGVDLPFLTAPSGAAHGKTTTKIDGEYYRICWANEVAGLVCDGTNWTKTWGKTIPMSAILAVNSAQNIGGGAWVLTATTATISNPLASMGDQANSKITCQRPGIYGIFQDIYVVTTQSSYFYTVGRYNGNDLNMLQSYKSGGNRNNYSISFVMKYGDYLEPYILIATTSLISIGFDWQFSATEVPTW